MVAMVLSRTDRSSSGVREFQRRNALLVLWLLMTKRNDIKKLWDRKDLLPREKFEAYLEGYLMSFDLYPICDRRLFAKKDAYALLQDFCAISADVNRGVQDLIENADSDGEAVASEEFGQRRVEAARRAFEAIKRARLKRSTTGS